MDASALLWGRWSAQVKELFPKIHGHQKKTLGLFVIGIVLAGSAVLQRVAEGISLHGINLTKMTSIERRLARFIANDRVVVRKIWEDFLSQVLPFWQGKPLRFVLDGTPIRSDATIVYLGVLLHSRVLPVAWAVMPGQEKWEEKQRHSVADTAPPLGENDLDRSASATRGEATRLRNRVASPLVAARCLQR